jgi:lipopolysaccharide biosynthesis protein
VQQILRRGQIQSLNALARLNGLWQQAVMAAKIRQIARFIMRAVVRLRLLWIFPKCPRVLEAHGGIKPSGSKRLCVFASFAKTGMIEEYVFYNLGALQKTGFDILFVTTSPRISDIDLQRLKKTCVRILRRENIGYDFGSWKAGLFNSGIDWKEYDQLLLTNDSYYGPLFPWSEALSAAQSDLYGITDSYGISYHLMSYFVLYNKRALRSVEFKRYWEGVRMVPTLLKTLIIYAYEVDMSQKFQKSGFSVSAYCPEKDLLEKFPAQRHLLGQTIVVHSFWRELIELMRCPILKTDTFWRVLQADSAWKPAFRDTKYDINLIERHQKNLRNRSG